MQLSVKLLGKGISAVIYREMRLFFGNSMTVILSLASPVIYMALFSASLNGLMPTLDYRGVVVAYIRFALPGILVMSTLSNTLMTSQSIFNEHLSNMLLDILSTPVQHRAYMTGKILAGAGLAFAQSVLVFGSGALIFRLPLTLTQFLATCLLAVPVCLTMSGLYMTVLGLIKNFRAFILTTNILTNVIMFGSSIFYPTTSIPPALRFVASLNPATYAVDAVRDYLLLGKVSPLPTGITCGLAALLTLTAIAVFRRRFAEI
jgi:ABC-2 type transport system permease protein